MIDTVVNLLFRCRHQRLTRPVSAVTKAGQPSSGSYVVCLDCGKQFEYDVKEMRMGRVIERSRDGGVVPPDTRKRSGALKSLVGAAMAAAVVVGAVLKGTKRV